MASDTEKRVDELRAQLRSLGYLDAGVDRFVLAAATDTRGPVGVAARTGARVGLLGGALLGPTAAIGLGARLPGLVSGVRDAVVLALYLAVFFVAAIGVTSFLVSLAAAAFAPARARGASRAAAWVFTIGSLLYLTLWWRNANAGFGWSAPVLTSFALIVAVAISLLLGHAVRIATLAVVAARRAGTALPPIPGRSWRLVATGGALAFAGASALLLATVQGGEAAAVTPALAVVNAHPIRLIALDGFDPDTYTRLKDRLPNLRAAFGGTRVHLQPQDTSDPARAWTTIATGVSPDAHGVHAVETRRVAGLRGAFTSGGRLQIVGVATDLLRLTRPALASSQDRKVKTIWEVAEQAGLRTAVVNWWATWPAPSDGGSMITDRGVLRLEHGGPLDGEIEPPALYDSLRAAWPRIRERATAAASTRFAGVADPGAAAIVRRSAELDATLVELLRALPPPARDLDAVYLPGLDIAQNSLLAGADPASASSVTSRIDALEQYYGFLDSVIAPLLDEHDKTTVMVITQPGRVRSSAGGLLAVWPGGVSMSPETFARPVPPTALDAAPTILHALGVPLSRELAGAALPDLFRPALGPPDRFVPSYGRPFAAPAARTGTPLDQEMIDRLRSLGYVK